MRFPIDLPKRELKRVLEDTPDRERQDAAGHLRALLALMQSWAADGKSVLTQLIPSGRPPPAYHHVPATHVHDPETGFRWFYHSHPKRRASIRGEHGHFHLFADLRPSARTTHLMALSVDARGLPCGIFLPNLWVTEDQSQSWEEISAALPAFRTRSCSSPEEVQRWLEHAVHSFRIILPALWRHRRRRLDTLAHNTRHAVTQSRRIEVLSRSPIDLPQWATVMQK